MALNTVTLTWDITDLIQAGTGDPATPCVLTITPTAQMTDTADKVIVAPVPRQVSFTGGTGQLAGIVANDNPAITPAGTGYTISAATRTGQVLVPAFTTQVLAANGASQDLSQLAPVAGVTAMAAYLPLPSGTVAAGDAPVSSGSGTATGWAAVLQALNNLSDLTSVPTALANLGIKLPAASKAFKPSAPTGTSSASQVMMGLASGAQATPVQYTPAGSGIVKVTVTGVMVAPTAGVGATVGGRYGTGTAPLNGAAASGTAFGPAADAQVRVANVSATVGVGFTITDRLALAEGTSYWFDLAVASGTGGDTVQPMYLTAVIEELLA